MILSELYLFAYLCFTVGTAIMFLGLIKSLWYTRYRIPKKIEGGIVLDEKQKDVSKTFTLLLPAFKETAVIENTISSIAKINYYSGKYHTLVILDEKELLEKARDSKIIIPTARDILDGCYSNDKLCERVRELRTDLKKKTLKSWFDYYLKNADILAFAVLSGFYDEQEFKDMVIPIAFSQLKDQKLNDSVRKNADFPKIEQYAKDLIDREKRSAIERERYLTELYEQHPFFETTIDVVKRLKKKYNTEKASDLIDYTIVPANYDGSYHNPQILEHEVRSSKGRALNWGLNEVEKLFPETNVIGVYDSDARPHKDVLAYINLEMLKSSSKFVFYQGPIYLVRNYFEVHWICKQSGLQGTCWHRILYPMYILKNQKKIIHFSGTNYFYTIDAIRKTDGYQPFHPTEDLGLAYDVYALRLEGKLPDLRIVPHPYEETEQTTQSWKAWFKQQYRWASGNPYQMRHIRENKNLPKKEKRALMLRLLSPFPISVVAMILGLIGVSLTTLNLLGLAPPSLLPPGMEQLISYIMLSGLVVFLATPEFIFLWSIKKGYLKAKSYGFVIKDFFINLITTIPYFIIATLPIMQAWIRPLSGWGAKTPRTDERVRTKEEEYLRAFEALRVPVTR